MTCGFHASVFHLPFFLWTCQLVHGPAEIWLFFTKGKANMSSKFSDFNVNNSARQRRGRFTFLFTLTKQKENNWPCCSCYRYSPWRWKVCAYTYVTIHVSASPSTLSQSWLMSFILWTSLLALWHQFIVMNSLRKRHTKHLKVAVMNADIFSDKKGDIIQNCYLAR